MHLYFKETVSQIFFLFSFSLMGLKFISVNLLLVENVLWSISSITVQGLLGVNCEELSD